MFAKNIEQTTVTAKSEGRIIHLFISYRKQVIVKSSTKNMFSDMALCVKDQQNCREPNWSKISNDHKCCCN